MPGEPGGISVKVPSSGRCRCQVKTRGPVPPETPTVKLTTWSSQSMRSAGWETRARGAGRECRGIPPLPVPFGERIIHGRKPHRNTVKGIRIPGPWPSSLPQRSLPRGKANSCMGKTAIRTHPSGVGHNCPIAYPRKFQRKSGA